MTTRDLSPYEPGGERRGLVQLVRRIQALTLELHELRLRGGGSLELEAKERTLEQLRWRLASAARRAANDDLDDIARPRSAAPGA
jgi:hypothetical protein